MGFIEKFVLPKETDLAAALQEQTAAIRKVVHDLYDACVLHQGNAVEDIKNDTSETRRIKEKNMKELLDVFIAPYDKESIFRFITQLDWVALSVKHFVVEVDAYHEKQDLAIYRDLFELLREMASVLEEGFGQLSRKQLPNIGRIHDNYDQLVECRSRHVAQLLQHEDFRHIIIHKDILEQLQEIAKRMQVTANTLEDMAIKIL